MVSFQIRTNGGGLPPFIADDYTDGSDIGPGTGPIAGGDLARSASAPCRFCSKHRPVTSLASAITCNLNAGAAIGTARWTATCTLATTVPVTEDDTVPIDFFRLADDLDGDGINGAGFIVDADGNIILLIHRLRRSPQIQHLLRHRNRPKHHADRWRRSHVDTHDLTNQHYMAKNQNNRLTVGLGCPVPAALRRFPRRRHGSILGNSFWDTSFTNNIVGPQVAMQWVNQRQRWRFQTDARFMFGYNIANWNQVGLMGEASDSRCPEQTLYGRPTAFAHGLREQDFAPVGELRVHASYHFTSAFALNFGYTGS